MNRIKYLRELNGELQSDLAKILNITSVAIGNYENEKRDIPTEYLKILSDHFDCSIDYLLGKTDLRKSGQQIDDILNEAMIGMSKVDYQKLTETQKKQIRDFAIYIKSQAEGDK